MEPRHARRRRTRTRVPMLLAVLLTAVVALLVLPDGKLTRATSAEVSRSGLLEPGADLLVDRCTVPFDGSAVIHFPDGAFDLDQLVVVEASDTEGWASGGGELFPTTDSIVRVHVPAGVADGEYPISISARGRRGGQVAELHTGLTVRVSCSAR